MAKILTTRNTFRTRRRQRVRSRVQGTTERPRLAVFRSLRHISAQLIDDVSGRTLATVSNRDVQPKSTGSVDVARQVGKLMAERAKVAKVSRVVFDRGGYAYHGQVKALAEGAREGGLEF